MILTETVGTTAVQVFVGPKIRVVDIQLDWISVNTGLTDLWSKYMDPLTGATSQQKYIQLPFPTAVTNWFQKAQRK